MSGYGEGLRFVTMEMLSEAERVVQYHKQGFTLLWDSQQSEIRSLADSAENVLTEPIMY